MEEVFTLLETFVREHGSVHCNARSDAGSHAVRFGEVYADGGALWRPPDGSVILACCVGYRATSLGFSSLLLRPDSGEFTAVGWMGFDLYNGPTARALIGRDKSLYYALVNAVPQPDRWESGDPMESLPRR